MLGGFEIVAMTRFVYKVLASSISKEEIDSFLGRINVNANANATHHEFTTCNFNLHNTTAPNSASFLEFMLRGTKPKNGIKATTTEGIANISHLLSCLDLKLQTRPKHSKSLTDDTKKEMQRVMEMGRMMVELGLLHYDNTYTNANNSKWTVEQLLVSKENESVYVMFETMINALNSLVANSKKSKRKRTEAVPLINSDVVAKNLKPCKKAKVETSKKSKGSTPEASHIVASTTARWNKDVQKNKESATEGQIKRLQEVADQLMNIVGHLTIRTSKEWENKRKWAECVMAGASEHHEMMQGLDDVEQQLHTVINKAIG